MSAEDSSAPSNSPETQRRGHGWWPYLVPYFGFLGTLEIAARLPEAAAPWMLLVKPAVPAALILGFARSGAYPELRGFDWRDSRVALDVAVGLGLALLWVGPFLAVPALPRPEPGGGFDPEIFGVAAVPLALLARGVGYAVVTPVFEELFIRSLVMRYAEVFIKRLDFRDVPIANFSWQSLIITSVIFTLGHMPWEYVVCVPWIVLSSLWFYWRGHLMAVVVVHAVTNGAILVGVVVASRFVGPDGLPLDLWYFV